MRLAGFYINGFGIIRDLKIEGISPELTIFLGRNESGKSTLLGFLRAILFGFPDGRSKENLYPPLAGGQHGGNVSLVTDDGQLYVVERYPGTRGGRVDVLKPDQTHGEKEFLGRLLGTATRTLFKNIYAFSLIELQNFETLNRESVGEALYSAGAGIDPNGLVKLKSGLEKKEDELFKPGGSKPRINTILSRLKTIQKEKKILFGSIEEYDRIRTRISQLIEEIDTSENKRIELSLQLKKNEQWINIWPDCINLSLTKQKLDKLEPIEQFPSEGISRFEKLKTRFEGFQDEVLKKEEELKERESELSMLRSDLDILDHTSSLKELQRDQGHFESIVRESLSLKEEISSGEKRLVESLNRLGPSWTEDKVLEFDLSIATREKVRHYQEILSHARLEEQRKRGSLENIRSRKREAEELLRNLPETPIKDPDHLGKMKKSSKELRGLESRKRLMKERLSHIDERLEDFEEEKGVLGDTPKPGAYGLGFWSIPAIIGAVIIFLIWFWVNNKWLWAISSFAVSIILALLFWILKSKMEKKGHASEQRTEQRIGKLGVKITDLDAEKMELKSTLDNIQRQIRAESSILSISEVLAVESIERLEEELGEQITQFNRWRDASEEVEKIKKRDEEARSELRHAESEASEIQGRWQEWLKDRGLDTVLSPDGALETLSLIESCREQIDHLCQLRSRIESHDETRKGYINLVNKVFKPLYGKSAGEDDIQVAVHNLIQEFSEAERVAQKKTLIKREIDLSNESIERLKGQIKKLEEEIQDLMASGGVDNEDQFRERANIYEKRKTLIMEMERSEDSIRRLSSNLGTLDRVIEEFLTIRLDELEEQKIRLERDIKDVEETLDHLKKEQARLEEQTRQLVNDERISALRAEEEGLKEELSLEAEDWSTIKLAQMLIRMARARYERERQPDVICEAGRFFNQITMGRYPSLVAPIGENRIEAVCPDNSRKEIDQLSRGTAEQLYLSLRFGFIREFSKRSSSLPIIMDEILVNFDPHRAKATVKGILDLSREHQVLFFTCHPEMASLFKEADPNISVLEISEGELKRNLNPA